MTTLLLIRHGQSKANLTRFFAGHTDVPLTELGLRQAECTARFLMENYTIDRVYSSDSQRAYATAQALAEKLSLPIVAEENLREIFAGQWEGMTFTDIADQYPEDYHCWFTDIGHCRPTGGESTEELLLRIEGALRRICEENPEAVVAVTTHATAIRSMQSKYSGVGLEGMKDVPWVVNASVTEFCYENGQFSLGKIGQAEHLQSLRTDMPANV